MSTKLPECWRLDPATRTVRIVTARGRSYVLPYEHFVASECDPDGDTQKVKIDFSSHEIEVFGQNLHRVEEALQRRDLAELKALPERFLEAVAAGHPRITHIDVVTATDADSKPNK